jgi:hypothetical protein
VIGFIFDVLGFLGPLGIALFFVSLLLLAFVGSFSPLPKLVNYLLIVTMVTVSTLLGVSGFEDVGNITSGLARYLAFMLTPVAVLFAIKRIFRRKDPAEKLKHAVDELTEQVAMLRREQGALPARETLTIEAKARKAPRRLVRRL